VKKKLKLSIIIPVKNEGKHILILLKIFKSFLSSRHEILIIYDDNNDKTSSFIENPKKNYPNLKFIKNIFDRGVAGAIKTGAKFSRGSYVLVYLADEIMPVLAIEDMVYLLDKGCDFVSATRYLNGGKRVGGSVIENVLSRIGNYFFNLIIGSTLTDSTTGIKMFKKNIFYQLDLKSNVGWSVMFEMAIKAQIKNVKLGEVPIVSIDRLFGGVSNFDAFKWAKEYSKLFLFGVVNLRKKNKEKKHAIKMRSSTF